VRRIVQWKNAKWEMPAFSLSPVEFILGVTIQNVVDKGFMTETAREVLSNSGVLNQFGFP